MQAIKSAITAFITFIALLLPAGAASQAMFFDNARLSDSVSVAASQAPVFTTPPVEELLDSAAYSRRSLEDLILYLDTMDMSGYDYRFPEQQLPNYFFMPSVYDSFRWKDTTYVFAPVFSGHPEMEWVEEAGLMRRKMDAINYALFFTNPRAVSYNINLLPEAPKHFEATIDPSTHTIEIHENIDGKALAPTISAAPVKRRHWIRTFRTSLQFSQAYVSPNWYQGGNSNMNLLGNVFYNVKLNQEFHKNVLFEMTAQYKLGFNDAPNDEVRDYNITDDMLQINATFGLRAINHWYYSFNGQFKTQLLNHYPANSHEMNSSLLSPGELTAGLGMTYNNNWRGGKVTFDASIAPLSYSLKTCINKDIPPTWYGVEEGHTTKSNFGSNIELKLNWRIAKNITYYTRIFGFTNYDTAQADWENTINFAINKFFSTQIYVYARYDSNGRRAVDEGWHKLQLKEILSFGFSYQFSSI